VAYLSKHNLLDTLQIRNCIEAGEDPVPLLRNTLAQVHKLLYECHKEGTSSQEIVSLRAWAVDQVLDIVWTRQHQRTPGVVSTLTLVAVGGYGRAELQPHSDIDLLLLHQSKLAAPDIDFIEQLIRLLWDIGLEVGHSVRTVKQCIAEAKADITVITNLLEARLLLGDAALFELLKTKIEPQRIWPTKAFFKAKMAEQQQRHARFNDTAYNLEPNIKEGPGGLRDIQIIAWVTRRHFNSHSLADLVTHDFLTQNEYRSLIRGRNFLWRLRNSLHFLTNRSEDRLLFDHQLTIALEFGYQDKPGYLAVEQLMKRYYRIIKELSILNEILLQHFEEILLARKSWVTHRINRRFQSLGGILEAVNEQIFENTPSAMLEIFLLMEQHKLKGIRATTLRQLRQNLHRIDHDFRNNTESHRLFMQILRQPQGITHALRRMNAYGVLGTYIPAFGRVVGQMQYDLFHAYTVDTHTLFVLRNLRRLCIPEFRHEFPIASELITAIDKKERLYLAAIFHDIGKGRGGDHSVLGERDAEDFCQQHGLNEYDTLLVAWLVRNHLLMSWTAQRKDTSDPEVVNEFANIVGDHEHLDHLYLLTMADIRGTNPGIWNTWKAMLLEKLYNATLRALRRGLGTPINQDVRIKNLKQETLTLLGPKFNHTMVEKFWQQMANDYFIRHDAKAVAWHTREIVTARVVELPLVNARYNPDFATNQLLVYAPDFDHLLPLVAGGVERLGLSVVDARIHITTNGMALYLFAVLARNGVITDHSALDRIAERIHQDIFSQSRPKAPGKIRITRVEKAFPIATQVDFIEPDDSPHTILELIAQDRPGLLHHIAEALLECKIRLVNARIATIGERADDTFYLTNRDGAPVSDTTQRECLRRQILARLGEF